MNKTTFLFLLFSFVVLSTNAQGLMRSTLGVSGSSSLVSSGSKNYLVQQSVGQGSVIGKFQSNGIIVRQGFIQPTIISSKIIPEETNLQAVIYPNPVNNQVHISFNEPVKEPVSIRIFDMLGRSVFTKELNAAQQLSINLSFLASAQYIFIINTGQKQFKANLIKQ